MQVIKLLHKFKFLRLIAKKLAKKLTIKQRFYNGVICLNAVEHSWAWTGKNRYETFDIELQKALYTTSFNHDLLIDIGCNIGVMTIGTLLHNPQIKAIAVDPNKLANQLLNRTLTLNQSTNRCQIINAAVGPENGFITFDETGSVTGHVSPKGKTIKQVKFARLLNRHHKQKTLVKIDVEGYETKLLADFKEIKNLEAYTFYIEVHESGFNETGNPSEVFDKLIAMNATITNLKGEKLNKLYQNIITQIIVNF